MGSASKIPSVTCSPARSTRKTASVIQNRMIVEMAPITTTTKEPPSTIIGFKLDAVRADQMPESFLQSGKIKKYQIRGR